MSAARRSQRQSTCVVAGSVVVHIQVHIHSTIDGVDSTAAVDVTAAAAGAHHAFEDCHAGAFSAHRNLHADRRGAGPAERPLSTMPLDKNERPLGRRLHRPHVQRATYPLASADALLALPMRLLPYFRETQPLTTLGTWLQLAAAPHLPAWLSGHPWAATAQTVC